jgi:hypothetical protein
MTVDEKESVFRLIAAILHLGISPPVACFRPSVSGYHCR